VAVVADALSCLDIYSLKIQDNKEEVLPLLSGSEINSISYIKLTIIMHTPLIFKEQTKVKEPRLREKGLAQPLNMLPREGHLKAIKRILSYLKKFSKGRVIIDTSYPDHSIYPVEDHSN
jgi:hypothetical protein